MLNSGFAQLRRHKDSLLHRPSWRLTSHFVSRLFSAGSSDSEESALGLGIGAILALVAVPGGFITIFLFSKYSSTIRFAHHITNFDAYSASVSDQYFFLAYSLSITGIATILKWDSIFPNRHDYMNLAPLPVPTRHIFLANFVAILSIAVLFAFDVNAVSAVLFPVLVTMEKRFADFLRFAPMHVGGVLLASLFIFFALFALIGTLMLLLPQSFFRRISLYLRVSLVVVLLALLSTSLIVPHLIRAPGPHRLLSLLPTVWFLELSRSWIGQADPQFAWLAPFAARATVFVVLWAAAVYVISYYRYFIRIPEMLDVKISRGRLRFRVPVWIEKLFLRDPFERGCYAFALKTLFRNDLHSLLAGAFAGLGLVMSSQILLDAVPRHFSGRGAIPDSEFLAAPLVLAYFIICGLRFVFELPAELKANWIHQAIVERDNNRLVPLARKVLLTFVWPWLILLALPIYAHVWGWTLALEHISFLLLVTFCLADLLLRRYRKIPFTCGYSAWRQSATVRIVMYGMGFLACAAIVPDLERSFFKGPFALPIVCAVIFAAWFWFKRQDRDEYLDNSLIFEDTPEPAVEVLSLSRL